MRFMSKFDHFKIIAPLFNHVFKTPNNNKLVELIGIQDDHCLLDVGGGSGRIAQLFKENSCKVTITDISMGMLRESAKTGNYELVLAASESLPYKNCQFDRIIMVDTFHHVINHKDTIKQLLRVLKPGGRLIIEEPDIDKFLVKLIALGEKLLLMRSHFKSSKEISKLLSAFPGIKISFDNESNNFWVIVDYVRVQVIK